jgi:NitT/TauT family transport system substrate-binding protein
VPRLQTNLAFAATVIASLLVSTAVLVGYLGSAPSASTIRIGYLPNITHAPFVHALQSKEYDEAFGPDFVIQAQAFNAGPTAIRALVTNEVDLIFIGPSPTLNGLAVTGPGFLRIIAGSVSGGALFVIQPGLTLARNEDFSGKKFASPQFGNTQDIALKHYLLERGHRTLDVGGDVDVVSTSNANILTSFRQGHIDGAWVPEPWATRLIVEAHGREFLDEATLWPDGRFVTTHLVTTKRYLDANPGIIRTFLNTTVDAILDLQDASRADLELVNRALTNATGVLLSDEVIASAFDRLEITYDPIGSSLLTYLAWTQDLGIVPEGIDVSSLYDLSLLNAILRERGLPEVIAP